MRSFDLGRFVLGGFAVAVTLAVCGGSQPPMLHRRRPSRRGYSSFS